MTKVVVAITGASGIQYAQRLLAALVQHNIEPHCVFSEAAFKVWSAELDIPCDPARPDLKAFAGVEGVQTYRNSQVGAAIASGSFRHSGMVVCPCTMSTLGGIANGVAGGLIGRAAEVTLKEGRKLIIVPRETPYSLVSLRNLVRAAEAGATILDANPAFYTKPESVLDMVDFVVSRILDQLGIDNDLIKRWCE